MAGSVLFNGGIAGENNHGVSRLRGGPAGQRVILIEIVPGGEGKKRRGRGGFNGNRQSDNEPLGTDQLPGA